MNLEVALLISGLQGIYYRVLNRFEQASWVSVSTTISIYSPKYYVAYKNCYPKAGCPVLGSFGPTEKPGYVRFRDPVALPRGSYPTPVLGYLVLWLGSVILKSRRPKKGVRYEPLGRH